jgi:pantoate--beta-alanine ligase
MGYLHDGHLSLVQEARAENDAVLATIFVNPTQFAANEDLSTYPRDLPRDLDLLERAGVVAVFTPTPDVMYPNGYQTYISVEQVAQGKEGASRPTHFRGVATVVAKLFNATQADTAYFGQKDAQQVAVIRRMARDLNFAVRVVVCPIVREADGLAMSSRNVYLTPEERALAPVLYRALQEAGARYADGTREPSALKASVLATLGAHPSAQVDYVSVARADNLQELDAPADTPYLLSLAVKLGRPRLLDNVLLPLELNTRDGATQSLGVG